MGASINKERTAYFGSKISKLIYCWKNVFAFCILCEFKAKSDKTSTMN